MVSELHCKHTTIAAVSPQFHQSCGPSCASLSDTTGTSLVISSVFLQAAPQLYNAYLHSPRLGLRCSSCILKLDARYALFNVCVMKPPQKASLYFRIFSSSFLEAAVHFINWPSDNSSISSCPFKSELMSHHVIITCQSCVNSWVSLYLFWIRHITGCILWCLIKYSTHFYAHHVYSQSG